MAWKTTFEAASRVTLYSQCTQGRTPPRMDPTANRPARSATWAPDDLDQSIRRKTAGFRARVPSQDGCEACDVFSEWLVCGAG